MPLTLSSFIVPGGSIPFLMEDKYLRGGFRVLSTLAERDAIPSAARKTGMRVLVMEVPITEYQLVGGTSNSAWQLAAYATSPHTHVASEITDLASAISDTITGLRGGTDGLAFLVDGKLAPQFVPAMTISETFPVADEAEMLACGATAGDIAVRVDVHSSFILSSEPATIVSNWVELLSPTSAIVSINGQTSGNIVLAASDVGAAPAVHQHIVSDITGLPNALEAKAESVHSHIATDISDFTLAISGKAETEHSHVIANVIGLQNELDSKSPANHAHLISDTGGLQAALDSKADNTALASGLSAKAEVVHNHTITEVTGLQAVLDGKSPTSHTHDQSDITGLVSSLSGKASTSHVHTDATTSVAGFMSAADKTKLDTLSGNGVTDLTLGTVTATTIPVNSSNGADIVLPSATSSLAGLQSAADKTKLDGIATGAQVNVATNLSIGTVTATTVPVLSSTGTSATLPLSTTVLAGMQSAADKTKLDGIAASANNYIHPTGDGNSHVPVTSTTNNLKVLKAGATANSAAWGNIAYSELTGLPTSFTPSAHSHSISDVTGLQTAIDTKFDKTGGTVTGNVTITGNLVVSGDNVQINASQLSVTDAIITAASGNTSGTAPYVGIKAERGVGDSFFVWTEATDRFTAYTSADDLATAGTLAAMEASTFYGDLSGNATSSTAASRLTTGRTITLTGDVTGSSVAFDGQANLSFVATVGNDSHSHSFSTLTGVAAAVHVHSVATISVDGFLSAADKTKLDGIATGAQANVASNLSIGTVTATTVPVNISTGTNIVLAAATTTLAGVMSGTDKTKLDGVAAGAQVNVATNLAESTRTTTTVLVTSSTGTNATLSAATTTLAGVMASADKTKLDGIAASANNYAHPTGDGNLHVPVTGTTNNLKILKAGATAGSAAWGNVAYSELTGTPSTFAPAAHTHPQSDITSLVTDLAAKLGTGATAANSSLLQGYATNIGAVANTVALRDSAGKLTAVDFTMTSDKRLKNIVGAIDDDVALTQVLAWESVYYTMKDDADGRVMPGFIAQQLQTISPQLVVESGDYLSVSYALSSAYYAAAFRALVKRLEQLENDTTVIR